MTGRLAVLAAVLAVAGTVAGCGSAGQSPGSIGQRDNVTVCQHYKIQRAHVKGLVNPTLADAMRFEVDVAADSAEAAHGTALARDLDAMSAAEAASKSSYASSGRVLADCQALGVRF